MSRHIRLFRECDAFQRHNAIACLPFLTRWLSQAGDRCDAFTGNITVVREPWTVVTNSFSQRKCCVPEKCCALTMSERSLVIGLNLAGAVGCSDGLKLKPSRLLRITSAALVLSLMHVFCGILLRISTLILLSRYHSWNTLSLFIVQGSFAFWVLLGLCLRCTPSCVTSPADMCFNRTSRGIL